MVLRRRARWRRLAPRVLCERLLRGPKHSKEEPTVKTSFVIVSAALLTAATTADAQGRRRGNGNDIPNGQRPPAGMCRIWIDGVPPGRQPAPTDCQTAVRNQPPNSQII